MHHDTIDAIENGLLTAIAIQGRDQPRMNLPERMRWYHTPGASIALIEQGCVAWAKGYGVLEAGGPAPVASETLFQAASISKPVAAVAALHVVESGHLDLDADVNAALRSWRVPENEHTQDHRVTLRGLLSHSAGLTVSEFPGYAAGAELPTLRQILDGQPPANSEPIRADAVPGSEYRYSGGGYTVLQQLLEDVTGRPFAQLMQDTVLGPLGMHHSTFEKPLPGRDAPGAASAHQANGRAVAGRWHTYPELAAAGLWTTPSDLARFAAEILASHAGRSNKVLSARITREMLATYLGGCGLGLFVRQADDGLLFSHSGWNKGFRAFLAADTATGTGVVVMTNSDNIGLLMEIVHSVASTYDWPAFRPLEIAPVTLDAGILRRHEGIYRSVESPYWQMLVRAEGDWLRMEELPDEVTYTLYPESEVRWVVVERAEPVEFIVDRAGRTEAMTFGSRWRLERVER